MKHKHLGLRAGLLLAALLLAICAFRFPAGPLFRFTAPQQGTSVSFLDVGQGDCILLRSGNQSVLVDAGDPEHGKSVTEYLSAQGIHRLYAAIATHPHSDHIGGMADVLNAFPTDSFYLSSVTANTETYRHMLDALESNAVTPTIPQPGDRLTFSSGAYLEFLWPEDSAVSSLSVNDSSIVCRFVCGDQQVLLTGDAEQPTEQAMLENGTSLSCTVLKVGHHGSDTSSSLSFLRQTHAKTAVISCGRENPYGHPSAQTLDHLKAAGIADVRNTAQDGTIVIVLN